MPLNNNRSFLRRVILFKQSFVFPNPVSNMDIVSKYQIFTSSSSKGKEKPGKNADVSLNCGDNSVETGSPCLSFNKIFAFFLVHVLIPVISEFYLF